MIKLGDVASVRGGKRLPKGESLVTTATPHPYIRTKDIESHIINTSQLEYLPIEVQKKISRYIVDSGDLIVSIVGTVGSCALVPEELNGANLTENCAKILVHAKEYSTKFLFYFLRSELGQQEIFKNTVGSTQLKLPLYGIQNIVLPELGNTQQKAIAHILGSLDDKIELNQKMNQTLEEIAKAIFKSWFVDFDPVRAKAEGRPTGLPLEISDLFPDGLVDSEIGEIPRGWDITYLRDQLSFVLGGDWGKAEESAETPNHCRCIRGADIADLQRFVWSDMPVRFLKDTSFRKRSLQNWDVVFEISGGSPTQSTGRCVLVTRSVLDAYDSPITTSNFCRLLRFCNSHSAVYHYQMFRSAYDRNEYFMYETGTTGIKNFGFKHYSEDLGYVLPSAELLERYFKTVEPMIKKSGIAMHENIVLSDLRDTLLPKLISGELRVPDAEKFLEEAGI